MPSRSETRQVLQTDRLPPHSAECEAGVIGCILLDPSLVGHCVEKIRNTEAFYDLRHRTIYELLVSMYDARKPIDMLTVQEGLKNLKKLEAVGGPAYVSSLPDTVPSAANLDYYLDILLEKYALRKAVKGCTEAISVVYESAGSFAETMDLVGRQLTPIFDTSDKGSTPPVKELVNLAISDIETFHRSKGEPIGLKTGFTELDNVTLGLRNSDMIVIAARPSMGKTSLAMNIAEHVALESRLPVGVFSLEMSGRALTLRMLCSRARVNLRDISRGFIVDRDFPKLTHAAGRLANAPLHIDDTGGLSILQLRSRARKMHQQHGIRLLVIDYLQLLHSTSRRADNRQQEIADISNGIKALAKELDIPVIVLSQLNRDIEKDKSRKPRLSDLRESGEIEQDADVVAMLYRVEVDGESAQNLPRINLNIAKQRNGDAGPEVNVELLFHKAHTRFESVCKIDPADLPYIPTSYDDKRD